MVVVFYFILEKTYSRLHTQYKAPENVECYLCKSISERRNGFFFAHIILNTNKNDISSHMYHLEKDLGIYLKHDNLLILGDLKSESKENCWNDFSNASNLKSFNKETTCLKNPNNALCTNLYLPNRPGYFQNTFQ